MKEQYRITANLIGVDEKQSELHINVNCEGRGNLAVIQLFYKEIFVSILKAMKDADKHAFYDAMAEFANEDLDDAIEFLSGENEND